MSSRSGKPESDYKDNMIEFIGYRLLYNMLTKSYKGEWPVIPISFVSLLIRSHVLDLMQIEKEIRKNYASNVQLAHLLKIKNAWYLSNYISFFRLYKQSNQMCKCLIDMFVERERKQALKMIIKS